MFCLENPRDGKAWWAAVYGVTQSWTRLKRLSSSNSRSLIRSVGSNHKIRLYICYMAFPGGSEGKESACNAGDLGLIPGSGRSPGEKVGYPLQYSWASLVAQLVKNLPAMQETWVQSLGREDPWRRERLPTPVFWPGEFHGL